MSRPPEPDPRTPSAPGALPDSGDDARAGDRAPGPSRPRRARPERRAVLLRVDPAVHAALVRWADDELRSVNAQVELLVRQALAREGRLPREAGPLPQRGRPSKPV